MSLRVCFVLCVYFERWPGSRQSALTRRNRRLVSSHIPQDKLVSAERGLVLSDRLNPSQDGPGFDFVVFAAVSWSQVGY